MIWNLPPASVQALKLKAPCPKPWSQCVLRFRKITEDSLPQQGLSFTLKSSTKILQ